MKKGSRLLEISHDNRASRNGEVYCRKDNKLKLADYKCIGCPLFDGTSQGQGVTCVWRDVPGDSVHGRVIVRVPEQELLRVSNLIDDNLLSKNPEDDLK